MALRSSDAHNYAMLPALEALIKPMIGRNDTNQCGKIVFEIERAILDNHKEETS
jgi:hypothetical protein